MMYKACLIHVACLFEQGLDLRIIQQLRKKQRGMALCETVAPCLARHNQSDEIKGEHRQKGFTSPGDTTVLRMVDCMTSPWRRNRRRMVILSAGHYPEREQRADDHARRCHQESDQLRRPDCVLRNKQFE